MITKFEAQGYTAPELTNNILDHEAFAEYIAKQDAMKKEGSNAGGGGAALESKEAD